MLCREHSVDKFKAFLNLLYRDYEQRVADLKQDFRESLAKGVGEVDNGQKQA